MPPQIIKNTFSWVFATALLLPSIVTAQTSDTLVLQGGGVKLENAELERFLQFKKIDYASLDADQRRKLLQAWFLRERLSQLDEAETVLQSEHYQQIMAEFGKELLAQLSLKAESQKDLPDFSKRANELYQSQLDDYTEPASIKVHVLDLEKEEASTIRSNIVLGSLSIEQAIKTYNSQTRWIHHKNSSPVLWQAAQHLSSQQALSQVLVFREESKLLYYLDQKEKTVIPFDRVKNDIVKKLQQAYIDDQQQIIINKLKQSFKEDVQVSPIYQ